MNIFLANSGAVGPVEYCNTNKDPNVTSAINQYHPSNDKYFNEDLLSIG